MFGSRFTLPDLGIIAFAGIVLGAAQFTMAVAFLTAEAATVAPFRYTVILLTTLFGYLFFGDIPGRICYWRRSHRDREWPLHLTA